MSRVRLIRHWVPLLCAVLLLAGASGAAAAPEGTLTFAMHFSPVTRWLDPAEGESTITPYLLLYALHDGLLKPMPGSGSAPSLAEAWSMAKDGLSAEFTLRHAQFHNGDPVTSDDVKFSFERYRGGGAKILKDTVKEIQTPAPNRVRFVFKEPWPDFPAFYGTFVASAGWVVPRKYVERVGEEGFRKAPIGAGPYKFVSFNPGVELVLEAFEQYWRKAPNVKRLVLKAIPDEATRLVALKRGEVDIAYAIRGTLAEELRRAPGLTLRAAVGQGTFWVYFPEQWDAKSPWHDRRVRLAVNHAMDRQAINQAETLGYSRITWSIIPSSFQFYWQPPGHPYDPARAKQLLAEAGYPNGFDAGDYSCDVAFSGIAEPVINALKAV